MNKLDSMVRETLRLAHDALGRRGELLSTERLQENYAAFNRRFGPASLASLDGEALLHTMHTHGSKDSLVYWLEFKNDDEFAGEQFGGIAGGSAHKFRLFRRKETGQWVTGGPQSEKHVSEAEAVDIARKHRDQLIEGAKILDKLPSTTSAADYLEIQNRLAKAAPDLVGLAWTHKYFSLLFPEKLDDYHNERWQRFNLIKSLQLPPAEDGLYVCAGYFVALANDLGWPMNHVTKALNERNGRPARYWRIGTRLGEKESIWQDMRDGGYIAIGWDSLGDLSEVSSSEDPREEIRLRLAPHYPEDRKTLSRKAGEIRNFLSRIEEGDIALAADGERILGLGRIAGAYRFETTPPGGAPHRRTVEWTLVNDWKLPLSEGLRTTVYEVKKPENALGIEQQLINSSAAPLPKPPAPAAGTLRLSGIPGRIQNILERKGQSILYGPPGTGKTHWALRTAQDLAALAAFGKPFVELTTTQGADINGSATQPGLVRLCTFHPGYGYEDFLEGYRPHSSATGQLVFELRDGLFKQICIDARSSQRKFFLLIDEINRGDIPRIFGELLTLLELNKRGLETRLPVSGERFSVPSNLYVIGTMNTADRSIALLDTALRRRFGFVELMPDIDVLGNHSIGGSIPLGPWLNALNERLRRHLGRDGRNLQIGHAYFLDKGKPVTEFATFVRILAEDIIPLLEEYCYEDYATLTLIIGKGLVDDSRQRIRQELFDPAHREALVQALLASAPEIVTSSDAVTPPSAAGEVEDPEAEDSVE